MTLDGMLTPCDCLTAASLSGGGRRREFGRRDGRTLPSGANRHFIAVFNQRGNWCRPAQRNVPVSPSARQRGSRRVPWPRQAVTLGPRALPTAIVWKVNLWKHINSFRVTIKRKEADKASCFYVSSSLTGTEWTESSLMRTGRADLRVPKQTCVLSRLTLTIKWKPEV